MSAKNAVEITSDEDEEYETEEYLVYVDLGTHSLDEQQLSKMKKDIKFLGLDTETPIMQFNNQLYEGTYEYAMGTHCFFKESKRPGGVEDECFQEKPPVLHDYYCKTNKVLKMRRIFVEEKETDGGEGLVDGENDNLDHLRVTKTYEEALNQFLKPGEKPPRDVVEITHENDEADPPEVEVDTENADAEVDVLTSVPESQSNDEQTHEMELLTLAMEQIKQKPESDMEFDDDDDDSDPNYKPSTS